VPRATPLQVKMLSTQHASTHCCGCCTCIIWPAAGAAHGVLCVTPTDLRGNESEGELHTYLEARGGGSRGSRLRWEQSGCVRRGLPGRPEGQVTWVTGEAQSCVVRARAHLLCADCSIIARRRRSFDSSTRQLQHTNAKKKYRRLIKYHQRVAQTPRRSCTRYSSCRWTRCRR
jgi:hypothetical protein